MNKVGEKAVRKLNPYCISLDDLYQEGKSRALTYRQMSDRIVDAVKAGQKVCEVFYGHPGVFVNPSHDAIARVRELGLEADIKLIEEQRWDEVRQQFEDVGKSIKVIVD